MKPVVECYVDAEKLDVSIGFYGPVPDGYEPMISVQQCNDLLAAERERCAKVVASFRNLGSGVIADAIRALDNK